jgi:protein-disulfide isomerase
MLHSASINAIKMKTIYIFTIVIISFLITVSSCVFHKKNIISNGIASIDGQKISVEEIDQNLRQEIYEKLYQIYIIRKTKLQEAINEKLIRLESNKYDISDDSIINLYFRPKIEIKQIMGFAKIYNFDTTGISTQILFYKTNRFSYKDMQPILLEKYINFQLAKYLDSLKSVYKVKINLQPPRMPKDRLDDIIVHYKGNPNSDVTVLIISDPECSNCRNAKPIYDNLYEKYNGKVRYGVSIYSREVRISSLAIESASNQNKFWEMYNSLFEINQIINIDLVARRAQDCGLETKKFLNDMQDSLTYHKIYSNFRRINDAGFYVTPSIIVNNKVISNPTSIEEIENVIDYELSISN